MTDEPDSVISFVSAVSGDAYLKVEEDLGDGFVRLRTAEAERRQAKHDIRSVEDVVIELLRNARDAGATRVFVASHKDGDHRSLTVIDDGLGIPDALRERIFEPRVTSKLDTMVMDRWGVHGRGMALFSVKSNVTTAYVACSGHHKGASVAVVADTAKLPERADQSTWPTVERDEDGNVRASRGPHNVVRRVVEFALEHPDVEVFIGTPAEIVSTLHSCARQALDSADLLFADEVSRLPVWQRSAAASDAAELTRISASLGASISERTAHRILAGELQPLETVLVELLADEESEAEKTPPDIYRDRRGLKIHHAHMAAFRRDLVEAFDALADKYYIHLAGEPKISVGKDDIRVRFSLEKDD